MKKTALNFYRDAILVIRKEFKKETKKLKGTRITLLLGITNITLLNQY